MKSVFKGTMLSILIFFSISFISVLLQLNSPIHRQIDSSFSIGFPFTYYHQFLIDASIPNSSWKIGNLIVDCFITWIIVIGIYIWKKR